MKDQLENRLHVLVCPKTGKATLTLQAAQAAIRADWKAAYKKYVPVAHQKKALM